jgi:hypothetical protein
VRLEELDKLRKSTSYGTRSRELSACSIVPQQTTLPRTLKYWKDYVYLFKHWNVPPQETNMHVHHCGNRMSHKILGNRTLWITFLSNLHIRILGIRRALHYGGKHFFSVLFIPSVFSSRRMQIIRRNCWLIH